MGIKRNTDLEILTKHGWSAFEGIAHNGDKEGRFLTLANGKTILATNDHPFDVYGAKIPCSDLVIGGCLLSSDGTYVEITNIVENVKVDAYDILAVDNPDNTFLANDISTSNCDELAFVNRRIALEFWTSVFPTLSCLSGDSYVLNPVDGFRRIDSYLSPDIHYEAGQYYKILDEEVWSDGRTEEASHLYVSPESDTLKITTTSGFKVECTLNHPLWVENKGMIKAKDLKIGDRVLTQHGMRCFGRNKSDVQALTNQEFIALLSSDSVMQLNRESSMQVALRLFKEQTDHTFKDTQSAYRIKLILANLGYKSTLFNYANTASVHFEWDYAEGSEYEAIKHIAKSTQRVTYDFTVPDSHTFWQNGILGSNTGGSCIITSTPTDDETIFASIWKEAIITYDKDGNDIPNGVGRNGFSAYQAKWDVHPDRTEEFKEQTIQQIGEERFKREHELEFVSEEETLLSPIFLKDLKDRPILKTSDAKVRWYKEPTTEFMYFVTLDPSMGTGGDNAAIQVYEFPSMLQVGEWMSNRIDPSGQCRILVGVLNWFKRKGFDEEHVWWTFENNGCGETINMYLREVEDESEIFGQLIKEKPTRNSGKLPRKGLLTTLTNKNRALALMKRWMEKGVMTVSSKALVTEFKTFVRSGATYKAIYGEKDDLVMASVLAVRLAERAIAEDEFEGDFGVDVSAMRGVGFTDDDDDDDDDDSSGYYAPLPVG